MRKGTGTGFVDLVACLKAMLSCERKGEVNYLFRCKGNFRIRVKNLIKKNKSLVLLPEPPQYFNPKAF